MRTSKYGWFCVSPISLNQWLYELTRTRCEVLTRRSLLNANSIHSAHHNQSNSSNLKEIASDQQFSDLSYTHYYGLTFIKRMTSRIHRKKDIDRQLLIPPKDSIPAVRVFFEIP